MASVLNMKEKVFNKTDTQGQFKTDTTWFPNNLEGFLINTEYRCEWNNTAEEKAVHGQIDSYWYAAGLV